MADPYTYENSSVLKNKLDITDEKTLDQIEAEQSRMNMMLLYEEGFSDFSVKGIQAIHRYLFGDIYDWAGAFRIINIQKREELLAGKSVWYSNAENIERDLRKAFQAIKRVKWESLSREKFVANLAKHFPAIWRVHPFREGNTRTVVMMMTFFVERCDYYMDLKLLAESAGYVRNSFVMCSIDELSEYEHLEKILLDAVSESPVDYSDEITNGEMTDKQSRYEKYKSDKYHPTAHEQRPNEYDPNNYKTSITK